jgi:N-acetylglucosaminyl-diphospho-decaprenol L-rhamnosyltransferase
MRAAVYIPNFNGARWLPRTLQSLRDQTERLDVVVVDNGSDDDSVAAVRADFPEVTVMELGENLGFGTALNRAVAAHPSDAIVLANSDIECEPGFCEGLIATLDDGIDMVAAVLLQESQPELIDSAGVVADRTLMGFDYLHGEPAAAAKTAPSPLGPTGGGALYRRAAFEAVGGFDERMFLYYEDLDLALRIAVAGGRCALAPEARAIHAYSASLGAASGPKYAATGWSRGYMLRRYGVTANRRLAARALAIEGVICAGQMLRDRTTAGFGGRVRGWRAGKGLPQRDVGATPLLEISGSQALSLRRRRRG